MSRPFHPENFLPAAPRRPRLPASPVQAEPTSFPATVESGAATAHAPGPSADLLASGTRGPLSAHAIATSMTEREPTRPSSQNVVATGSPLFPVRQNTAPAVIMTEKAVGGPAHSPVPRASNACGPAGDVVPSQSDSSPASAPPFGKWPRTRPACQVEETARGAKGASTINSSTAIRHPTHQGRCVPATRSPLYPVRHNVASAISKTEKAEEACDPAHSPVPCAYSSSSTARGPAGAVVPSQPETTDPTERDKPLSPPSAVADETPDVAVQGATNDVAKVFSQKGVLSRSFLSFFVSYFPSGGSLEKSFIFSFFFDLAEQ